MSTTEKVLLKCCGSKTCFKFMDHKRDLGIYIGAFATLFAAPIILLIVERVL